MAQLWSTGPVALFYVERTSGTIFFIGHGARAPDIHERAFWSDVHCDVGGQAPIDRLVAGLMCSMSVELNRYSEAVVQDLRARARSALLPAEVPGALGPGGVGTLSTLEGASVILYALFPNIAKPAFQNVATGGPGVPGYRFFAATLDDVTVKPGSSKEKTINCQFTCIQAFNAGQFTSLNGGAIVNAFGNGQLVVYDNNVAAAAALNWT